MQMVVRSVWPQVWACWPFPASVLWWRWGGLPVSRLVPSPVGHHVRKRILEACDDLSPRLLAPRALAVDPTASTIGMTSRPAEAVAPEGKRLGRRLQARESLLGAVGDECGHDRRVLDRHLRGLRTIPSARIRGAQVRGENDRAGFTETAASPAPQACLPPFLHVLRRAARGGTC